jgi:hypothetical protein
MPAFCMSDRPFSLLEFYSADHFAIGSLQTFTDPYSLEQSVRNLRIIAIVWNFEYLELLFIVFGIYITADGIVELMNQAIFYNIPCWVCFDQSASLRTTPGLTESRLYYSSLRYQPTKGISRP